MLCCANHPVTVWQHKAGKPLASHPSSLPAAALLVLVQHPLHQTCLSSHSPCYPQLCCCPILWGGRPCWSSLDPRSPGQTMPPVWLSEGHQALVTCSQQTWDKTRCWLSCMPRNPPRCINCSSQSFRDHWLLLWRQMLSLAKDSWNMQVESLFK